MYRHGRAAGRQQIICSIIQKQKTETWKLAVAKHSGEKMHCESAPVALIASSLSVRTIPGRYHDTVFMVINYYTVHDGDSWIMSGHNSDQYGVHKLTCLFHVGVALDDPSAIFDYSLTTISSGGCSRLRIVI